MGTADWLAVVFLAAGIGAVLTGLLPAAAAGEIVRRVLPLLIFLGSVFVLAELTAKAEVFDVVASRLVRWGAGNYLALFGLCVVFASATTIFLNLDTTAVLLTPVMLATAAQANMPGMPLAMLTAWLANTASLLLPVSNLTNLLAYDRVNLTPAEFAIRMAAPQAAAILATAACLWFFYWRRGRRGSERYTPPAPHVARDRTLFRVAAVACIAFALLVLLGAPLAIIIWYERCRSAGVRIAWGRFAATGAVTAVVTLVAAEGALLLSGA